jgi:hypothetical protein
MCSLSLHNSLRLAFASDHGDLAATFLSWDSIPKLNLLVSRFLNSPLHNLAMRHLLSTVSQLTVYCFLLFGITAVAQEITAMRLSRSINRSTSNIVNGHSKDSLAGQKPLLRISE